MKPGAIVRQAMTVLTAITVLGLGMGGTASAKSVWAMIADQNPNAPNGIQYDDVNGEAIAGETDGYDKLGNLCQTRSYYNGNKSTMTCPVNFNFVTYESYVKSSNNVWCPTTTNSWYGPIVFCQTGSIYAWSNGGGWGYYNLGVFGRGQ
jgi:hypothetical protein